MTAREQLRRFLGMFCLLVLVLALAVQTIHWIWPPDRAPLVIAAMSQNGKPSTGKPVQLRVPVDVVARAKFSGDSPDLIDKLAMLNRLVNGMIKPVSDLEQYGRAEMWVMYPDSMAGDCEDYVLSKIGLLTEAGFPIVNSARLRSVAVHRKGAPPDGHALLELRLPSGSIAFLDNNFDGLMTRAELVAHGYEFFDW